MSVKALLVAAVAASALATPAAALTVTEDFETLAPKDTPLPALVSPVGTFTGLAGSPFPNVFIASPGYTNFGPGNNPTTSSVLVANGDESFEVSLAFAAQSLSMTVYLNDLGGATISAFNGANLLASFTFPADGDSSNNLSGIGFFVPKNTPITRFTFVSVGGGQLNTGIDNVSITAVPEPATWAAMLAGFALAGFALRRQGRRALA